MAVSRLFCHQNASSNRFGRNEVNTKNTIVILAEFAAPQTTRSVSLEKTQTPTMSSVQRKTDRDFGKFRNYRKKICYFTSTSVADSEHRIKKLN